MAGGRIMWSFIAITALLVNNTEAGDTRLVTVGILAQPSSESMARQFNHTAGRWSYIAGSYVDFLSTTGAMPVLIPFDIDKRLLLRLLENIDGFLLPGGGAELKDPNDLSETTNYQKTADFIIRWAIKRNDEGHYFPIMGTCLGFENFIITFSNNTKALECNMPDFSTAHVVQTLPEFDKSPFWSEVGTDLAKEVFSTPSTYFTHLCGIRTANFYKNNKLHEHFDLLATSSTDKGIEFVACIEHKKYPFTANQFHPEKGMYNKGDIYDFLDRNRLVIDLDQRIASKFIQRIKERGKPRVLGDIDRLVKSYFASRKLAETLMMSFYSRVYVFPRYTEGD